MDMLPFSADRGPPSLLPKFEDDVFSERLDLHCWVKCAQGHQREVYETAVHPHILIKTIKREARGPQGNRLSKSLFGRLKCRRRFGAYMTFRREIEEYLDQARKVDGDQAFHLPIARIFGLAHTSMGLGLIVERIGTSKGQLAPTLTEMLQWGRFQLHHLDLINDFFEQCRLAHIVLMDINPSNFVVTDRNGREELVCVDGTGEKTALRLYSACRFINGIKLRSDKRKLLAKLQKLAARLDTHSQALTCFSH